MAQQVNFLTLLKMQRAAKEINILFNNDAIDLKANEEALRSQLLQAKELITLDDEFTEETQAVLDALEAVPAPKATGKKQEKAAEEKIVPDAVVLDYEELTIDIEDAEELSELKQIAAENAIFSGIFKRIKTFKNVEDLREALMEVIMEETGGNTAPEPAAEIPEELAEIDFEGLQEDIENAGKIEDLKAIAQQYAPLFDGLGKPLKSYKDFDELSEEMLGILEYEHGTQIETPKQELKAPVKAVAEKPAAPAKPEKKKSAITVVKDAEVEKPVPVAKESKQPSAAAEDSLTKRIEFLLPIIQAGENAKKELIELLKS